MNASAARVIELKSNATLGSYELWNPMDIIWNRLDAVLTLRFKFHDGGSKGVETVRLGRTYRKGTDNDLYPDAVIIGTMLHSNDSHTLIFSDGISGDEMWLSLDDNCFRNT